MHGGADFREPVRIDRAVRDKIAALVELAPLHQPRGIAGIDALTRLRPDLPAVACFDTAFHATLPECCRHLRTAPGVEPAGWDRAATASTGLSHAPTPRAAPHNCSTAR